MALTAIAAREHTDARGALSRSRYLAGNAVIAFAASAVAAVAVLLAVIGFAGFRRRDVPLTFSFQDHANFVPHGGTGEILERKGSYLTMRLRDHGDPAM